MKIAKHATLLLAIVLGTVVSSSIAHAETITKTLQVNQGSIFVTAPQSTFVIPQGYPGSTVLPTSQSRLSTYEWVHFESSDSSVVAINGATQYSLSAKPVNGTYIISSAQSLKAVHTGTATITASAVSRYVCGNKVQCPGIRFVNRYALTISVVKCGPVRDQVSINPQIICAQ